MYQSTDRLVSNEQGVGGGGYQAVEGSKDSPGDSPRTLLADVRKAKEESQGCCEFCLTFLGLLIGSIVWTIILVITLTLPLVMIVIGAEHFHDCKVERMIPIFLIVGGSVLMVSNVMNLIDRYRRIGEREFRRRTTVIGWITLTLNIFLLAWFIAGCYWVYGVGDIDFDNKNLDKYCHPTLYFFSFWLLNACFIFFVSMVIVASFLLICAIFCYF